MCGQRAVVDDMCWLCLDSDPLQIIFSPPPQIVFFSSNLHLIFFWCLLLIFAIFLYFSLTLSVLFFPLPLLVRSLSYLSFLFTFALAFCCSLLLLSFPLSLSTFLSFLLSPPSLTHNCLFVYSLSLPSVLIPLVSLTLIFPISLSRSPSCLPPPYFLSFNHLNSFLLLLIHTSIFSSAQLCNTLSFCPS